MKIALINGQNHKGSTYHIGRMLADKLGGEVTEFFLPRDFGEFCCGCTNCFMKGEEKCPHYEKLDPITKAVDEADVLILTSPVYVYHCSGVLSDEPLFFLLNSYTTGLSPSVMAYILRDVLGTRFGGNVTADEIGLPVEATGGVLPCGSTAIWQK